MASWQVRALGGFIAHAVGSQELMDMANTSAFDSDERLILEDALSKSDHEAPGDDPHWAYTEEVEQQGAPIQASRGSAERLMGLIGQF